MYIFIFAIAGLPGATLFWRTSKLLFLLVLLYGKINVEVLPLHYTYQYTIVLYSLSLIININKYVHHLLWVIQYHHYMLILWTRVLLLVSSEVLMGL